MSEPGTLVAAYSVKQHGGPTELSLQQRSDLRTPLLQLLIVPAVSGAGSWYTALLASITMTDALLQQSCTQPEHLRTEFICGFGYRSFGCCYISAGQPA